MLVCRFGGEVSKRVISISIKIQKKNFNFNQSSLNPFAAFGIFAREFSPGTDYIRTFRQLIDYVMDQFPMSPTQAGRLSSFHLDLRDKRAIQHAAG